jgi:hypothetical protein
MKPLLIFLIIHLSLGAEPQPLLNSFIETYCFSCHDEDTQKADLDLQKLFSEKPLVKNLQQWRHVIHLVREGDMPPRDKKKQPTQTARQAFVSGLQKILDSFDYSKIKNPGTEPLRRLSNRQYQNTINDLFASDLSFDEKLNIDFKSDNGFSNAVETLFVQTSTLEKFYAAAEYTIAQALPVTFFNKYPTKSRGEAEKLLKSFMNRAYRRPVSGQDFSGAMNLFDLNRKSQSFEESIKKVLTYVLASSRFLIRVERRSINEKVDSWDMASRLSYFLWGTMPDKQLFDLAKQGKLQDSQVLEQQLERMVQDPRFQNLGMTLGAEWLKYSEVGVRNRPDPLDNPQMTASLYRAMKQESALFFTYLYKKNKPIEELLTARYTFLNQELSRFYRIGGIRGDHMRPVRLKTAHRGGILTHASILMVTSHPDRSSPVLRGNWVLSTLLGTPPPPPPANVGELDDEKDVDDALKQHSSKKQCAGCHKKIDPLGLALKNFDQFGRWHNDRPAQVELDDGTKFRGLQGLKKALVDKRLEVLKRQVVEKTLSFALGRHLQYYDESAVRRILKTLELPGAGYRDILIEIVKSYPFRNNRHEQED